MPHEIQDSKTKSKCCTAVFLSVLAIVVICLAIALGVVVGNKNDELSSLQSLNRQLATQVAELNKSVEMINSTVVNLDYQVTVLQNSSDFNGNSSDYYKFWADSKFET